jgi:prepilin-type N-terminal cleavage/methylation domain-containing protein/prepilin-type processing-associated H-X9-DG protein
MTAAKRPGRRSGFTLIELLVVLAIIGILIGLLLPAVQKVREAAGRAACVNNLKQIGLALQNYHDTNNHFPAGYVSGFNARGDDTGPGWGWAALILPQMEQRPLYDTINFALPIEAPANAAARVQPVKGYRCPSDTGPATWTAQRYSMVGPPGAPICDVASANYVGMFGTSEPGVDGEGLFFRGSQVAIRDVTDGTSSTIAAGERSFKLGDATWVGAVTGAAITGTSGGLPSVENASCMVLGHAGDGNPPGGPLSEINQFASNHGRGANFVFADGHVSFLPATTGVKVFEALATRAGNETISGDY